MYILKQYNTPIAKFELSRNIDGKCVVLSYEIFNHKLLPLDMEPDAEGIASWLRHRNIPSNREYVDNILFQFGLNHRDTIGILNICKGLSLNDSYWVVDEDFDGDFYKYNLYTHRISRILSFVAFTGFSSKAIRSSLISSPEFTTNGMLPKCWRRINGDLYLYKAGTEGFANSGKEPFSEFYAYQIAKTMGLDAVEYSLANWKGHMCSTCKLFTDIDTSFIPVGRIVREGGITAVLEYYKKLGEDYYDKLISMFVFDAIICNTDRHYGNFGFLIDNASNEIVSTAPIFDNGLSLFNYGMDDEIQDPVAYSKTRLPAIYDDYVGFVKPLLKEVHKKQIRKLINFKFKKHPRYNLDDYRLKKLEEFIQIRIRELLD